VTKSDDFEGLKGEYFALTRALVAHLEANEDSQAEQVLDQITRLRERSLFQELGKLTREFHEALNTFRFDSRIATLTETDIPDARQRLNYVITMTEQSANRTLGAIEESTPICDGLHEEALAIQAQWERFIGRELDAEEFRQLARRLSQFLALLPESTDRVKTNLNDVLMAQDFQDLTGQIIRKVITLVEELERNLVDLVRISGQKFIQQPKEEIEEEGPDISPSGPPVPGVDQGTVSGQDEVDDLLSSLGF